MHGYVPPWRASPLLRWGPAGPGEDLAPERFQVEDAFLDVLDAPASISSAVAAVCDLVNHHGSRINDPAWNDLKVEQLELWHYAEWRISGRDWPASLAAVCDTIGRYDPTTASDIKPGRDDSESSRSGPATWRRRPYTPLRGYSLPHTRHHLKRAIQGLKLVAVGFAVGESYDDLAVVSTGKVRVPGPGEPLCDGACLVLTGWDDQREVFHCRNHRGKAWGRDGTGTIPYDYVVNPVWTHELVVIG